MGDALLLGKIPTIIKGIVKLQKQYWCWVVVQYEYTLNKTRLQLKTGGHFIFSKAIQLIAEAPYRLKKLKRIIVINFAP